MKKNDILSILAANRDALNDFSVKSLSIFGSVARDEATDRSDVDILVEFDKPTGLFGFIRLMHYLEEILGVKVDLATPNALRTEMRQQILKEAIRAA